MIITHPIIINLDKDIDRWKIISNKCVQLKIPYRRFSAIYGKDLTKKAIYDNTNIISRNCLLSYSMLGCALSHIKIMEKEYNKYKYKSISNNLETGTNLDNIWIQIWEDDTLIHKDYHSKITRLETDLLLCSKNDINIYNNLDIIKLHPVHKDLTEGPFIGLLFNKLSTIKINNLYLDKYNQTPYNNSLIIKCSSIPKILDFHNKYGIISHIDFISGYIPNLNIWYLRHFICPPNILNIETSNNINGNYPRFTFLITEYVYNLLQLKKNNNMWFGFSQPILNIRFTYNINILSTIYLIIILCITLILKILQCSNYTILLKIFLALWILEIILYTKYT